MTQKPSQKDFPDCPRTIHTNNLPIMYISAITVLANKAGWNKNNDNISVITNPTYATADSHTELVLKEYMTTFKEYRKDNNAKYK